MEPEWMDGPELAGFLEECPAEFCDLVLELRELIRKTAPGVCEGIRFHSLFYFKPGFPYGSIGGNVCAIGWKGDELQLAFLHGAFLPDPEHLLKGKAKAKRHVEIRSRADIRNPALRNLIRAALQYDPTAP